MFEFVFAFYQLSLFGFPLSKWLTRVFHPPTVALEEVPVVVPTHTSSLLPTKTLDVLIVNEGSDKLWQFGLGILVLVLLSSLALVSQKIWARRALVFAFIIPALVFITLCPALLETWASLDFVALRDDILDWLGLSIDAGARLPASPNVVVGGLIQNTARVADFLVYWSGLASSAASIVKSHAAVLSLYTFNTSLAIVVQAVKALQDISLPSIDQLLTGVNAYWTYWAFRSCMETVICQFMSSLVAHRPSSQSTSLLQLLQPLRVAFLDAKRALAKWFFLSLLLFLDSYIATAWTLSVFLFVRREAIRNLIRRTYILDKLFKVIAAVLPVDSEYFSSPERCGVMLHPFSYELTISLPNWDQVKTWDLQGFSIERDLWDDSLWLDREEVGASSKGGWCERTWKYGYAWFTLHILVGPPAAGSGSAQALP